MKSLLPIVTLVVLLYFMDVDAAKQNILFFSIDDLRPEIKVYYNGNDAYMPYHSKLITPNMNKLARKSLLLKNAHCQYATCGPSRASFMTGRRPDTTHVIDLKTNFRNVGGNFTTIGQFFKENGYMSVGMGKIYHPGSFSTDEEKNDPLSWSPDYEYFLGKDPFKDTDHDKSWRAVTDKELEDLGKGDLKDKQVLNHTLHMLDKLAPNAKDGTQPFFMAVGFLKPHLPFTFPEKFLDKYPKADITLPSNPYPPVNMPEIAWTSYGELRGFKDIAALNLDGKVNSDIMPNDTTTDLRRAYYASVSYTDDLVGQVIDKVNDLGLANNTIIMLSSDHGWQLGEHAMWSKHNNFELSTKVPLMLHIPGKTDDGIVSKKLVEMVDIFPTLVEAAGFTNLTTCPSNSTLTKLCTEGSSFMRLIKEPKADSWKDRVYSQYKKKGKMGYTMRTERYRYTEWVKAEDFKPDWTKKEATELYDHKYDPAENYNQAGNSSYSDTIDDLKDKLHNGWRDSLPS